MHGASLKNELLRFFISSLIDFIRRGAKKQPV
jgi:hypothetical protein